ncbi:hypothetical protein BDU57DRAFT_217137 [Ampelomyces quisqualis]|uniref:Uncharacterized protein n=1 Tax=Ampelomyces quisqualis TaxID=50730 RepID=A0A6A5QL99_AMPQU|nr:hypothetical protein BDU57DRAFT_217137 [Ampelomyces quisqualis]
MSIFCKCLAAVWGAGYGSEARGRIKAAQAAGAGAGWLHVQRRQKPHGGMCSSPPRPFTSPFCHCAVCVCSPSTSPVPVLLPRHPRPTLVWTPPLRLLCLGLVKGGFSLALPCRRSESLARLLSPILR